LVIEERRFQIARLPSYSIIKSRPAVHRPFVPFHPYPT
jgi:hypothetical protein